MHSKTGLQPAQAHAVAQTGSNPDAAPVPIVAPTAENIAKAAEALRAGQLVGMPTETVYGLAALACDPLAVARTFAAKQRPSDNPLIVHLASTSQLPLVVRELPTAAERLAAAFWPGPLTLVLPRHNTVLLAVTGGLDTVAVRVPDHAVARALITAAGAPLTAPSANRFMQLSPTTAQDLAPELRAQLSLVLDGGPCRVGLESTVVDCTNSPQVLRPGGVTRAALAEVLGHEVPLAATQVGERRSPGQYQRHYAPRTPLRLVEHLAPHDIGLTLEPATGEGQIAMPSDPEAYGATLYRVLHALDELHGKEICVQRPARNPAWEAVWDRLQRAATD